MKISNKNNKAGISSLAAVLIVAVLIGAGGAGAYYALSDKDGGGAKCSL